MQSLIRFIVADDQVSNTPQKKPQINCISQSINVMECHKFHNLLMLCEDLEEDIPHHTILCKAIITSWWSWFSMLKTQVNN